MSSPSVDSELSTQFLYRVQIRSAEKSAGLRLVLRRWSDARFESTASDALGRGLWTLTVSDGLAAWSERSRPGHCRLDPARVLDWPRLGLALAPRLLPALLTGARNRIDRSDLGALEWQVEDRGGRLAAAAGEVEITWREVTREPLRGSGPFLPADLAAAEECDLEALP